MRKLRTNANAATLAAIALIMLGVGIFSPFITMKNPIVGVDQPFSLVGGIGELYQNGYWFLATLLLTFSILFPIAKLALLLAATNRAAPLSPPMRVALHHWVGLTAKYSMLDIFVVAIMVVVVKLKDLASVSALSGTYIFCGAIMLSILAGYAVDVAAMEGADHEQ